MKIKNKPAMLMILDGYGLGSNPAQSAILQANTPGLNSLFSSYPHTKLVASGLSVGLPEGQMGNSEVGHLNIGAGRIVYQDLTKISKSIEDGDFFHNQALISALDHVSNHHSSLHLIGLLSDGGVHSHISHLFALLDLAKKKKIENVFVHCFLDGRDVAPRCALNYIKALEAYMKNTVGTIATICGRYYAMDRDRRWGRIALAYDAMTLATGIEASSAEEALALAYARGETDEFVMPTVILEDGKPVALVEDDDAIIMFNFRPDRARQITRAFVSHDFDGFVRSKQLGNLAYICLTQYDAQIANVGIAFPPKSLNNTLGECIADLGLTQLRIAETEKYAHVTFFFNGGIEAPLRNEERILIDSPKIATYDLKPEMSAYEVTEAVIEKINEQQYDLIILNFANADMVGHTGNMQATIKAIGALDQCVLKITETMLEKNGQILLTADHGNAEYMLDAEGNTVTAHSLNPVPLMHIAHNPRQFTGEGKLADIAPTLLDLMGLPIPPEMTGRSLVK